MPSRLIVRSFLTLAALVGFSAMGATAQAGIIVTVGKPCPEVTFYRSQAPAGQRPSMSGPETSETRCVVMPDGQIKCAKAILVDTVSALPSDWRCVQVAKAVLYCETPSFGGSPGAAGEGRFEPGADDDVLDDGEIQALGCSGGVGGGALAGFGGLLVLGALRRRRQPGHTAH